MKLTQWDGSVPCQQCELLRAELQASLLENEQAEAHTEQLRAEMTGCAQHVSALELELKVQANIRARLFALENAVREYFDAYSDWERDEAEVRLRDLCARQRPTPR